MTVDHYRSPSRSSIADAGVADAVASRPLVYTRSKMTEELPHGKGRGRKSYDPRLLRRGSAVLASVREQADLGRCPTC